MDKNFLKNLYTHLAQLTAEAISELRKDKKDILSKSDELKQAISESGDLSVEETAKVTTAINSLHESIKSLIEATNASKTENVTVDNLTDAIVDLTPLERNFEALKVGIDGVKEAIDSIEPAKAVSMSGVEKLLGKIVDKKDKEVDVSELEVISDILEDVLRAVQMTANHTGAKKENPADKIVPELKSVQEILTILNKNVEEIDLPEFDYKKLAKIIKDNLNISIASGGGSSSILRNIAGNQINPGTEETLQAILAAQGGSVYNYIQSEETATYKYYGYASSTGWKIKRKTLATGIWMVDEGTGDYDTNWALRASKVYAYT